LPPSALRVVRWPTPDPQRYRALFTRVGAPWLWFSRLALADDALTAVIGDAAVHVHAVVDRGGIEVGMLELDFRVPGDCEIAYFGVIPELAGQRHGRWLMAHALASAWRAGITRVWLHSCTLDHPHALGFYRAQGFVPFARAIETFVDPRVAGILPADCAPQVALLSAR
jgi:GNAT superfamily N-acetyltransferase